MKLFQKSQNSEALIKWAWLNTTWIILMILQALIFLFPVAYLIQVGAPLHEKQVMIMMFVGSFMCLCFLASAALMGFKIRVGYWLPIALFIFSLTRLPDDYMAGLTTPSYWAFFGFSTLLTMGCFFLERKYFAARKAG